MVPAAPLGSGVILGQRSLIVSDADLYFDESGTHAQAKLMTVAGYWFNAGQASKFSRDWAKCLARLGLSYAHMTDCALGYGEYRKMGLAERIQSEVLLIENIKRRTRFGFAVTVDSSLYAEIMRDVVGAPTCYSLCLMTLVNHIWSFAVANDFEGRLFYNFEAGHASAKEANQYLNAISLHGEDWVRVTRYGGHAFVDKLSALPLQAADMLAWQTRHYFERKLSGHHKPRKDFVALVRKFDLNTQLDATALLALRDSFLDVAPLAGIGDHEGALVQANRIFDRYGLSYHPPPRFKR